MLLRVLSGRMGLVSAAVAGALLPLAFAPFHLAWLAVLSPALFFAVVASAERRRARQAAYLFGLGFYGVGVSWVYVSMAEFGAGGWLVSGVLTVAFIALLALFPVILVMLMQRLAPERGAWQLVLALPLLWVLLEWVRSWLLTGFPWLLLGYSQTDSLLAPVAPVFGVLGVSWLLALLAGCLAWLVLRPSARSAVVALATTGVVLALGPMLEREWTQPAGEPIRAALVQGNMPQDIKWDPAYLRATMDRYRELTEQHWDADLIVWPESAIPILYHQIEHTFLREIAEQAAVHGTDLLLGIPVFDREREQYHNSVVSITGEGGQYHKRHLVPFGEYLPLRSVFGRALDILGAPMADFVPGTVAAPIRAAGQSIAVSICYEVVFGHEIARLLPAASLLVNVSNDAWFGNSLAPHQHLQMARMRALETGREMLRGTNTGITVFIDHRGRIVERAPQFEAVTLVGAATPRQGTTPYVIWTDWPVLGTMGLGLLALIGCRWRRSLRAEAPAQASGSQA